MLRLLTILFLLAPVAQADNIALVLTRSGGEADLVQLHTEITTYYTDAGFTVTGGLDLDRSATLSAFAGFGTADAGDDGHVVVHLSGGMGEVNDLPVYIPADVSEDALTSLTGGAIPVPLFLQSLEAVPGRGMLVMGHGATPAPVPQSSTTLVLDGPARAAAGMVATRLLAEGQPPAQIITEGSGVRLTGLVSDTYRLGRVAGLVPDADPVADTEAQLLPTRGGRIAVQVGLALLGYEPGETDGTFGQGTRRALADWASSNGFEPTGYLDPQSHEALLAAITEVETEQAALEAEREAWATASASDTVAAYQAFLENRPYSRFAPDARDRLDALQENVGRRAQVAKYKELELSLDLTLASVATLEQRLASLGFDPGAADGRVEISTRRAIARYQAQIGLVPTGYLNPQTIRRLIISEN